MMKFIERAADCVRVQCEDCGAHTQFEWNEYRMLVAAWRFAWCSTCGALRLVGLEESSPAGADTGLGYGGPGTAPPWLQGGKIPPGARVPSSPAHGRVR
jgi:hypothetical protein